MIKLTKGLITLGCLLCSSLTYSQLAVFACEPEWAALANALGGEKVSIYSATTELQDPHHIQARPSLIAKVRQADMLLCTGAELESGWLPVLLKKSGNPAIQHGAPGYFMAAEKVSRIDVNKDVDRSMGDVHASGNPHVHLDPLRMIIIAQQLTDKLTELLPEDALFFNHNFNLFESATKAMLLEQESNISFLKGHPVVLYHDSWAYFTEWLQLETVALLEPKPGIPPSTAYLSQLVNQLEKEKASAIIYASYQNTKSVEWLAKKTSIPVVELVATVPHWEQPDALIDWYKSMIKSMVFAASGGQ